MNVYSIRLAILTALREYRGMPVCVDDLIRYAVSATLRAADKEELKTEWQNLVDYGYLTQIDGFAGTYCKLSDKGLAQLAFESKHDPYIYGPTAR